MSDRTSDIIFCEGCGARLAASDRTCPKCGRPAPGILSTQSASSDLAAGRTASFPRLTPELIAEGKASSAPQILAESLDPEATNILDADRLREARDESERSSKREERAAKAAQRRAERAASDDYRRPRRGRWVALACVVLAIGGAAWFVAVDPWGVMPGVYESIDRSAAEMFPSRQIAESPADGTDGKGDGKKAPEDDDAKVSDSTLSDEEAYQRLSVIYGRILQFQDEEIGTVVDDYNAWYIASDRAKREDGSKSAYAMRDEVQKTIDELDGIKLADGSAYGEDVKHLEQLAGWMYNRVDVLCRSWDISLDLPEGESPSEHRSEITAPLTEAMQGTGENQDVVQFEANVYSWKPQQK